MWEVPMEGSDSMLRTTFYGTCSFKLSYINERWNGHTICHKTLHTTFNIKIVCPICSCFMRNVIPTCEWSSAFVKVRWRPKRDNSSAFKGIYEDSALFESRLEHWISRLSFSFLLANIGIIINHGCLHPIACVRSRWGGFSVYVTLLFLLLNCCMFQSYDHLQLEIYLLENYSTDNGSVIFLLEDGRTTETCSS
jgi:hypothetical protein